LADSFYGEFYSATLQATGGTGVKTWTISSGSLPRGLNLDHTAGIISGVLSDEAQGFSGSVNFDVKVTDAASVTATQTLSLAIRARAPRILTTRLPDAVVGRTYRVRIAATDPTATLLLDTTQGILPPGIAVNASQTLIGVPTTQGTFSFVLQLFTNQVADQRAFTITVVGQGTANRNDDISNAPTLSNGTYFA